MRSLTDDLREVRERIAGAAARSGRDPEDVTLVAVSKTLPVAVLEAAFRAGALDLGENRAQELHEKASVLEALPVRWHFVGHLQTNKVKQVVGTATLIHSVDRLRLAEAISTRAVALGVSQDVLIEVNVSGEMTKQGVEPSRCLALAAEISELRGVRVKGLMTMAPLADNAEDSRPFFTALGGLSGRLRSEFPAATELSMGMTRDFEVAVEAGATIVRVGEAIFGPRV